MQLFKSKTKPYTSGDVGIKETIDKMIELGLLKKRELELTKQLLADEMNGNILKKCIGKFYISDSILETNPEFAMEVMSKVIVVKAEHVLHKGQFEYFAVSHEFEEVKEGCCVPEYQIYCNDDGVYFEQV